MRIEKSWLLAVLVVAILAIAAIIAHDTTGQPQNYAGNISSATHATPLTDFEEARGAAMQRRQDRQSEVRQLTATWPPNLQETARLADSFLYDAAFNRSMHAECEDRPPPWHEKQLRRLLDNLLASKRLPSEGDHDRLERYYDNAEDWSNRDFNACFKALPSRWTSTTSQPP